jgi:hypothetical protein
LAVEDLQRRQSQADNRDPRQLQDRSADPALVEVPLPIFAERVLGGAPDRYLGTGEMARFALGFGEALDE